MIQYNQLSAEGGLLYIDILVDDKPYYDNIYITGVKVYTADTYADRQFPIINQSQVPSKTLVVKKRVAKDDLLFIVPEVSGAVSEECPCGGDVCEEAYIYCDESIKKRGLAFLKELTLDCTIPKGFIDFILKTAAFDLSLQTCNYNDAAKYWKHIKGSKIKVKTKNCGCHG